MQCSGTCREGHGVGYRWARKRVAGERIREVGGPLQATVIAFTFSVKWRQREMLWLTLSNLLCISSEIRKWPLLGHKVKFVHLKFLKAGAEETENCYLNVMDFKVFSNDYWIRKQPSLHPAHHHRKWKEMQEKGKTLWGSFIA